MDQPMSPYRFQPVANEDRRSSLVKLSLEPSSRGVEGCEFNQPRRSARTVCKAR
jgi:hypothetical protein